MTRRDGFARLVRAEWTKFRTVRSWVIGAVVASLVIVLLGLFSASGSHASCSKGPVEVDCPEPPRGPEGQAVSDRFYFVHRTLEGDGGITVRVTSMTGEIRLPDLTPGVRRVTAGVVPWAKAGVIVKDGMRQGSPYAALMVTGRHGVRMQHNYVHDLAGRPGGVSREAPRWLRLTRSGDTLTGYESADGARWTTVGTVRLAGLGTRVEIGLFATSPCDLRMARGDFGGSVGQCRFAEATADFDHVSLRGEAGGAWSHDDVGATRNLDGTIHHPGRFKQSGGTFTVTGVGDIAPHVEGQRIENTLTGTAAGLIVVIVVAVLFITAEYRRGLIRTTLLASPRRGRVLAAKAVVIAAVTFVAGLAAAAVVVPVASRILRANGNVILPVSSLTELRVVVGFAALLAVGAVLALALGALFRRGAAAVTTAIALILLPYLLATSSVLPLGAAQWLLRLTPAAGFAIQQSIPEYPHMTGDHAPAGGSYPLPPWAGLAVFAAYAAIALGLAVVRLRRRDA